MLHFNRTPAPRFCRARHEDAAIVATLPPGNYTEQAKRVGGTTGVARIEIYVVQ